MRAAIPVIVLNSIGQWVLARPGGGAASTMLEVPGMAIRVIAPQ
jgi:hypothetical protein